eukprot:NODE_402_length_8060_cov_0.986057.p3 type:complete len:145 gc:universal NODE_402_length_8060_cov_0.986057:3006-2572(-)
MRQIGLERASNIEDDILFLLLQLSNTTLEVIERFMLGSIDRFLEQSSLNFEDLLEYDVSLREHHTNLLSAFCNRNMQCINKLLDSYRTPSNNVRDTLDSFLECTQNENWTFYNLEITQDLFNNLRRFTGERYRKIMFFEMLSDK